MSPWRRAGIPTAGLLLIVAVVLAIVGGEGGSTPTEAASASPYVVEPEELAAVEDSLGHPLYWAGDPGEARLELRQEADGSVYLRYLPTGVAVGTRPAACLTVGTYPVEDAPAALQRTAKAAGSRLLHLAGGAVVLPNPSARGSVYLAYPDSNLEIEVYDPAPGRALRLIRSGAIEPVNG